MHSLSTFIKGTWVHSNTFPRKAEVPTKKNKTSKKKPKEKARRYTTKNLASKPDLSQKFRDVVLDDLRDRYFGMLEVAKGGTYQRLRLMKKITTEMKTAPTTDTTTSESGSSNSSSNASSGVSQCRDTLLFGEALRRHNEVRQKSRLRSTFGMINRDLIGPERRIEITLTSKNNVDDPITKIGRIMDAIARVWRNDDVFCIWVRAVQERGVWHYHLAVFYGGELELCDHTRKDIGDYVEERWQAYADQDEPVKVEVRLPTTVDDLDILDAYDAGQNMKQKKAKPESSVDDDETTVTKKTKLFGIIRRDAYWRHVQIKKIVVEDLSAFFTLRRNCRRALQARMRSWSKPRQHRPHRFAVEGRFHLPERVALQLLEYIRRESDGDNPQLPDTPY